MGEFEQAVKLANTVLDKPYIDPDSDICMLARQFLRTIERAEKAEALSSELGEALHALANLYDVDRRLMNDPTSRAWQRTIWMNVESALSKLADIRAALKEQG